MLLHKGASTRDVFDAVRRLLDEVPTVLVLEDMHWADEATLDVLCMLARRVQSVSALVIATYRDDQVDRAHPLQAVLGELATTRGIARLELEPLSRNGVAELAEGTPFDVNELYQKTSGNPFYVSQVLEADGQPMTVRAALQLINEVLDEYLASGEGDFDADTRFAITWYEQHGWEPGPTCGARS